MADGTVPTPSESGGDDTSSSGSSGSGSGSDDSSAAAAGPRPVSLPDNGWPQGRYWWTVVPVEPVEIVADPTKGRQPGDAMEYHDVDLPQDLCAKGQVWPFGVQSAPVTTTSQTPYASGVVKGNRVVSAAVRRPSFEELPVVTWQPALGAQTYELQLSRKAYPWKTVRSASSVVTSAVLPLAKRDVGTWYYRVRGLNANLVGPAKFLAWSKPVAIRISGDRFRVVG
jgi:hypothetical protein